MTLFQNLFNLDELVKEEKSFEGFSIFRLFSIFGSSGHLVQRSEMI